MTGYQADAVRHAQWEAWVVAALPPVRQMKGLRVPKLIVVTREGQETTVDGRTDLSVMEVIRDSGFDEMLALCGGCCSCATCQVHVSPGFKELLPPMSEDESDLLDSSDHRDENSRLSCQIKLTEALDGLKVTIAQED